METRTVQSADRQLSRAWGTAFIIGLLLAIVGAIAISSAWITSLASVLMLGIVLVAGGLLESIHALRMRNRPGALLPLLSGLFTVVVGALFLTRPVASLATVSLLLAAYFLGSGLFRSVTSATDRYENWGWDLFYGLAAIALGVVIAAGWPISSFWIVGTLVGIEIFMRGVVVMGIALALRHALPQGE